MFTKALSRQYMENLLPTISGYAMKPLPAVDRLSTVAIRDCGRLWETVSLTGWREGGNYWLR
jgi:hypothetical protein